MLLQDDKYSCGACAIVNALRAVGHRVTVEAAAELAGTDPVKGTPTSGVRRALGKLDYRAVPVEVVGSAPQAAAALRGWLVSGHPVILSWQLGEHWVAAIGALGDRFVVANSSDEDLVRVYGPEELTALGNWREESQEGYALFVGVAVVPR